MLTFVRVRLPEERRMGPEARNVYSEIKRINPEIRWIDLEGI